MARRGGIPWRTWALALVVSAGVLGAASSLWHLRSRRIRSETAGVQAGRPTDRVEAPPSAPPEILGSRLDGEGSLVLRWNPGSRTDDCSARGLRGALWAPLPTTRLHEGEWQTVVTRPDELSALTLAAGSGDGGRTLDVGAWARDEVPFLSARLAAFPRDEALASVHAAVTKPVGETFREVTGEAAAGEGDGAAERHRLRLEALERELEARLGVGGALTNHRRLADLSALVLGSALLRLETRLDAHAALRRVDDVVQAMAVHGLVPRLPAPSWGSFAQSRTRPTGDFREVVLFQDFARPRLVGVRVPFAPEGMVPEAVFETAWEGPPPVRAWLCVTVSSFLNQVLRLTVGDRASFLLVDRPVAEAGPAVFTFYQAIPGALLGLGTNRIRLLGDREVGRQTIRAVSVHRLALLVQEEPAKGER